VDARLEGESPAVEGNMLEAAPQAELMQQSSLMNRNFEGSIIMQLAECEGQVTTQGRHWWQHPEVLGQHLISWSIEEED